MPGLIHLTLSPPGLRLAPGAAGVVTATIHNRSWMLDQITLGVNGVDPAWVQIRPPTVSIYPQEQASAQIIITIPPQAAAGGPWRADVRAVSYESPGEQVTAALDVSLVGSAPSQSAPVSPTTPTVTFPPAPSPGPARPAPTAPQVAAPGRQRRPLPRPVVLGIAGLLLVLILGFAATRLLPGLGSRPPANTDPATAIPVASLTDDELQAIAEDAANRFQTAKAESQRTLDTSKLELDLAGEALSRQIDLVNRTRSAGCFWEISVQGPLQVQVRDFNQARTDQQLRIVVTKTETRQYFCGDPPVMRPEQTAVNDRYTVEYVIALQGDRWVTISRP